MVADAIAGQRFWHTLFMVTMRRFLCSHLVALSWSGGEVVANLEEIWENGAVLDCEREIPLGVLAELRPGGVFFAGWVRSVEHHEFGWRVEMELSPLTPWGAEQFRPAHLLDLSELG